MAGQSPGPVHIVADIQALDLIRARMRQLRDDLAESASAPVYADVYCTGDDDVTRAVGRFVEGWRDGREQVLLKLDESQKLLTHAVDSYIHVENVLGNAITGTPAAT